MRISKTIMLSMLIAGCTSFMAFGMEKAGPKAAKVELADIIDIIGRSYLKHINAGKYEAISQDSSSKIGYCRKLCSLCTDRYLPPKFLALHLQNLHVSSEDANLLLANEELMNIVGEMAIKNPDDLRQKLSASIRAEEAKAKARAKAEEAKAKARAKAEEAKARAKAKAEEESYSSSDSSDDESDSADEKIDSADINSRDAYKILGVRRGASVKEIRSAYKIGVLRFHPDKHPDDPKATEKFQKFQSAYESLMPKN